VGWEVSIQLIVMGLEASQGELLLAAKSVEKIWKDVGSDESQSTPDITESGRPGTID